MKLYPHQLANVRRLVDIIRRFRAALDLSKTGTGKTYTALAVCRVLGLRPFIVCPKSVITKWKHLAAAFGLSPLFVTNYEDLKFNGHKFCHIPRGYKPALLHKYYYDGTANPPPCRFGFTYAFPTFGQALAALRLTERDLAAWEMRTGKNFPRGRCRAHGSFTWKFYPADVLMIFDEVQRCKGEASINCKMLMAAKSYRVLALSATPGVMPWDFKAIGHVFELYKPGEYREWLARHGVKRGFFREYTITGADAHLADLHRELAPRSVCTRIEDLEAGVFKENFVSVELIDVPQWQHQNELYEVLKSEIGRLRSAGASTTDILVHVLRYRQAAELFKVPALVELAGDYVSEGFSVVIFCNYMDTVKALSVALESVQVHGEQTATERSFALAHFQTNKVPICICNIAAGGVGVDLHDLYGRPRVSLLCPTYDAIPFKQALGRIHRAGAKSPAQQRILCAAGTIEEKKVKPALEKKLFCIDLITDGDFSEGAENV